MRETIDKKVNALGKQEEQQRQLREGGNVEEAHRKNKKQKAGGEAQNDGIKPTVRSRYLRAAGERWGDTS